jgi:hypothetical protein
LPEKQLNNNQSYKMIKHSRGEIEIKSYTAPASTAFDFNDVVTRNSAGKLAKATSTTPRSEILGLIQQTIATTDSDYASDKVVAVLLPCEGEFEADVSTGTLIQAMVGKRFDLDDEDSIDVNTTVQRSVEIVRVLSTSKAIVKFVTDGDKARLVSYTQHVVLADFTDGGSTAGTLSLNVSIPAGAVFERTLVKGLTGTVGESTAVIIVGDGTDTDRYNTGTPSVAADAAAGIDMGAPSGTLFHADAKTPIITVTEDSDFGDISAGLVFDITLFWYQVD